jgi:hypothetical protein
MNPNYHDGADRVVCLDVDQFYANRGENVPDAGELPCTNAPGAADESADGGPVLPGDDGGDSGD